MRMIGRGSEWRPATEITYAWSEITVPSDATNLALAASGVVATASTAAQDPTGVINGNHTLAGWGRGNGWEAAPAPRYPNWFGDWLEVAFPEPRVVDTVIVYTFPEHARGRNKMGLRTYQLQARDGGTWET